VTVATTGGFVLSVLRPRWSRALNWAVLATLFVPAVVLLVPLYRIIVDPPIGPSLIDNYLAVWLPAGATAFNVVLVARFFRHDDRLGRQRHRIRESDEPVIATDAVDGPIAAGADQPCARVGRNAVALPLRHRDRERVLQRLLGHIEVAEEADERCERSSRLLAIHPRDGLPSAHVVHAGTGAGISMIGRTSIAPVNAPGIRAARPIASSRSFASTR